ncbi:MAG: DUF58 domain-containing protein [Spirochaetota bacterium]|nr:DUF58 domain-containing protein [Spirochaetota bacterium]
MLSEEMLKKIQSLHFKTKHIATDLFAGQYVSAFKGRGMEFAEVREYYPGDDIRTIDWNVSARFGHPYVKVFHEERELTVMLLLDISGSNLFGTRGRFKRELLAEVAGMLAFLAIRTNDKVGAILFTSHVEKYIPPKKGASHVWRLIKEIFTFTPEERTTNIDNALTYLNKVTKRHAIVFLISDCIDKDYERSLRLSAKKHDLSVIRLADPAEELLPDVGLISLRDPETGDEVILNSSDKYIRKRWSHHLENEKKELKQLLSRSGVDMVELSTNGPVVEPLLQLFERKGSRQ